MNAKRSAVVHSQTLSKYNSAVVLTNVYQSINPLIFFVRPTERVQRVLDQSQILHHFYLPMAVIYVPQIANSKNRYYYNFLFQQFRVHRGFICTPNLIAPLLLAAGNIRHHPLQQNPHPITACGFAGMSYQYRLPYETGV